jgi:hypothetical protein
MDIYMLGVFMYYWIVNHLDTGLIVSINICRLFVANAKFLQQAFEVFDIAHSIRGYPIFDLSS